jgi:hypothetical protein
VLRQTTETRKPTETYDRPPEIIPSPEETPRLLGRVVVEAPAGDVLVSLAVFDSDLGIKRTVTFLAPEGRFRIAAYGAESFDGEKRDFVVRGPLLVGVRAEELAPAASPPAPGEVREPAPQASAEPQGQVEMLLAGTASKLSAGDLSGMGGCLRINLTGEGGGEWWLLIRNGKCDWGRGMPALSEVEGVESATATVSSSVNDALDVARGEADGYALWNAGRITVAGDSSYVKRIADALGIDTGP